MVVIDNGWIGTDGSHFVSCQIRTYDVGQTFVCVEHDEKIDNYGNCPGAIGRVNVLDWADSGSNRSAMQFETSQSN